MCSKLSLYFTLSYIWNRIVELGGKWAHSSHVPQYVQDEATIFQKSLQKKHKKEISPVILPMKANSCDAGGQTSDVSVKSGTVGFPSPKLLGHWSGQVRWLSLLFNNNNWCKALTGIYFSGCRTGKQFKMSKIAVGIRKSFLPPPPSSIPISWAVGLFSANVRGTDVSPDTRHHLVLCCRLHAISHLASRCNPEYSYSGFIS